MVIGALLILFGIPAFRARTSLAALTFISIVLLGYTGWASNILSLAADLLHTDEVAQITGLSGTSGAIGGMLFTLGTGWLVQNASYGAVFIAGSGMIVCAAVVSVAFARRTRTQAC
jgi:sugar phosphate permease